MKVDTQLIPLTLGALLAYELGAYQRLPVFLLKTKPD